MPLNCAQVNAIIWTDHTDIEHKYLLSTILNRVKYLFINNYVYLIYKQFTTDSPISVFLTTSFNIINQEILITKRYLEFEKQ